MVDPTALNEQIENKRHGRSGGFLRAFIVSIIGAIVGAAVCVLIDYFFMGNITSTFYLIDGMTAYAFYLYFVERQRQSNIHVFITALACLIAVSIAVFVSCAVLYVPEAGEFSESTNFIGKTFDFYVKNISDVGFSAYKDISGYHFSMLQYHILCPLLSWAGLGLSWLFVTFVGGSWEKKHGRQDYSYSGRKHKAKKKGKRIR